MVWTLDDWSTHLQHSAQTYMIDIIAAYTALYSMLSNKRTGWNKRHGY